MPIDLQTGRRFSQLYLAAGEPLSDSPRMRLRLGAVCPVDPYLHNFLEAELGVRVPVARGLLESESLSAPLFFRSAELRDVLDGVTLVFQYFEDRHPSAAKGWLASVVRIFEEERIGYRVDDLGGIHYAVDGTFEVVTMSALSSLREARYENASSMFEQAMRALDAVPPDGKASIRATFAAAEGVFRVLYPAAPRLGAIEADRLISPDINRIYSGDQTARHAAAKLLGSFKHWIDGAHFYRHEPGQLEVAQPPLQLAVLMVQQGAGFIRWLAQIDRQR